MGNDANESCQNSKMSFVFALGFPLSLILLGVLEATHTPEPMIASDNSRVVKVGGCFLLGLACSALSGIFAALPLSRGNLWPVAWLVSLALGWMVFMRMFDWSSFFAP